MESKRTDGPLRNLPFQAPTGNQYTPVQRPRCDSGLGLNRYSGKQRSLLTSAPCMNFWHLRPITEPFQTRSNYFTAVQTTLLRLAKAKLGRPLLVRCASGRRKVSPTGGHVYFSDAIRPRSSMALLSIAAASGYSFFALAKKPPCVSISGVQPDCVLASNLAPWSTRYCTIPACPETTAA